LAVTNVQIVTLEQMNANNGDTAVSSGEIKITNTYDELIGSLTINKTNLGLAAGLNIPGTTRFDIINFNARPGDGTNPIVKSVYWSEFENGSITIELPVGQYTVVEDLDTALVDGYDRPVRRAVYANERYADVVDGGNAVVSYFNTYTETYIPKPVLSVVKEADVSAAKVGDTITYTITVTNTGDATASNVTIVDSPDNSLDIVEIGNDGKQTGGKVTWSVATLPANVTWSATVKAVVKSTGAVQTVNTVTATDGNGGSGSDEEVVTLNASLKIKKTISGLDSQSEYSLKNKLTFTITDPNGDSKEYSYNEDFFRGELEIENPIPGVYTIVENNAEVKGYILDNGLAAGEGSWEVEVKEGATSKTLSIRNVYTSKIYNIWFDGGNHGDVRNELGNPVSGVWRNLWTEIHAEEESYFDWSGFGLKEGWKVYQKGIDDTNNLYDDLAENHEIAEGTSVVLYHFTWADWLDYKNEMSESKPGLSVEEGWKSDKEFYLDGGSEAFSSFEAAVEYMNANEAATIDANGFYNAYYVAVYENDPVDPPYVPPYIPSGGDDPDPDPVVPPVIIEEPEVPLADEPVVEIPDEEVPLANVPMTGDETALYAIMALASGLGLVYLALSGKKREDEMA